MTDHGPALPRAKSTLYDAGTGIAMIVRPPTRHGRARQGLRRTVQRGRPGAHAAGPARRRRSRGRRQGLSHAATAAPRTPRSTPGRDRGLHDEDLSRFVRSDPRRSAPRNTATSRTTRHGPLLDLPWDIADSAPGQAVAPLTSADRARSASSTICVADPTEHDNLLGREPTRQGRGDRRRPRAAARRLAPEDQRRHPVRIRRHPNLRALHRDLHAHPRRLPIPAARRSPPTAASTDDAQSSNSSAHRDRRTLGIPHQTIAARLSRMSAARPRIWCSPRSAAAARCWSSRCARPASPASRRSSSSTCRPPASRRSRGEWFAGVERRVDPAPARSARRGQARPRARRDLARLHPHRRAAPRTACGAAS